MKHERKKISKIVDEVLTYFLHHYNSRAEIAVIPEPHQYTMRFRFEGVDMDDEHFDALYKRLIVERQPELEDYYWQLAGEIEDNNELMLIAMMCDTIEMQRDGNAITLEAVRKF